MSSSSASQFLQANPIALRTCIYYESLSDKSIYECFESFKKVTGLELDYPMFEHWFLRFKAGNLNMEEDDGKCPARLMAMPVEVAENIFGRLELKDRLNLRKVSETIRCLVDTIETKIQNMSLNMESRQIDMTLDNHTFTYANNHDGSSSVNKDFQQKAVFNVDKGAVFLGDIFSVLKNPKLELVKLEVKDTASEDLEKFIKLWNHELHVEELQMTSGSLEEKIKMLRVLKAGVLKSIVLNLDFTRAPKISIEEMMAMDQVKKSNLLTFNIGAEGNTAWFPIEHFLDVPRLELIFDGNVSEQKLEEIVKALLHANKLEYFRLRCNSQMDIDEMVERMDSGAELDQFDLSVCRFGVKDSWEALEVRFEENGVTMRRLL